MRNPLALATLVPVAIAMAIVIGCGDGNGQVVDPPGDYFQSVNAIIPATQDCLHAAEDENMVPDSVSDETRLNAIAAYDWDAVACVEQEMGDFDGLAPPRVAQDAHDAYVTWDAYGISVLREHAEIAANAESIAEYGELQARFRDEEALNEGVVDACRELKRIAAGIDVDLLCADEF